MSFMEKVARIRAELLGGPGAGGATRECRRARREWRQLKPLNRVHSTHSMGIFLACLVLNLCPYSYSSVFL